MPLYEYVCRDCNTAFESRRTMADADAPIACPSGHDRVVRRLSVFAATGRAPAGHPAAGSGGGCGAGCACMPG